MSDGNNVHTSIYIFYLVNHSIITDPKTPTILSTDKFTTT